ncbi:MAG TPA: DNA polymerase III subunit delta', partial [Waddliaceae bacterium]
MTAKYFKDIVGNEPIKRYLCHVVEKGTIPQSLLFAGPEGAGKRDFAVAFAQTILGTDKFPHPDVRVYKPEGKIGLHSIQSMRQFCAEVYLAPFEAKRKIFIIHDAHRMLS